MEIQLQTLTPLWTGGLGKMDRIHETGIIGSLRWWYEAMVRGLGGYMSDPTSDDMSRRCEFDTRAYQEARRAGQAPRDALTEGLKPLGAVEYLFGATGWARLFRLRATRSPRVPLHFRSTVYANRSWLQRLFGREEDDYAIDDLQVLHGDFVFEIVFRGYDVSYAQEQLALLLRFVEMYGGLGAKLQHGFGQVTGLTIMPKEMMQTTVVGGLRALERKLDKDGLRRDGSPGDNPYNLKYFFYQTYPLADSVVYRFTKPEAHIGNPKMKDKHAYLPCAFDLRYKGSDQSSIGFRRWLREEKGWEESDDPPPLGQLDKLMGPRSQWEDASGRRQSISDELRTASRVCFGMPVKTQERYQVSVFGFAPPDVLTVEELRDLCSEYMRDALNATSSEEILGKGLIEQARGDAS